MGWPASTTRAGTSNTLANVCPFMVLGAPEWRIDLSDPLAAIRITITSSLREFRGPGAPISSGAMVDARPRRDVSRCVMTVAHVDKQTRRAQPMAADLMAVVLRRPDPPSRTRPARDLALRPCLTLPVVGKYTFQAFPRPNTRAVRPNGQRRFHRVGERLRQCGQPTAGDANAGFCMNFWGNMPSRSRGQRPATQARPSVGCRHPAPAPRKMSSLPLDEDRPVAPALTPDEPRPISIFPRGLQPPTQPANGSSN